MSFLSGKLKVFTVLKTLNSKCGWEKSWAHSTGESTASCLIVQMRETRLLLTMWSQLCREQSRAGVKNCGQNHFSSIKIIKNKHCTADRKHETNWLSWQRTATYGTISILKLAACCNSTKLDHSNYNQRSCLLSHLSFLCLTWVKM